MHIKKKLKLTLMLVKRDMAGKITDFLGSLGYKDYFSTYGKGSASLAILDYLGIGETENALLIYPSNEEDAQTIMNHIRTSEYLKYIIAFRVPVKGISRMTALKHFLKEDVNHE